MDVIYCQSLTKTKFYEWILPINKKLIGGPLDLQLTDLKLTDQS